MSPALATGLTGLLAAARGQPRERLKPLAAQVFEIARLRLARGIGPRYCLTAGLNQRDVTAAAVLGHINAQEYRRFVRHANPPELRGPLNNKIEQKRLLTAAGLPTPALIYGAAAGKGDPQAFADALAPYVGRRIAVKPIASFGGKGFRSFVVRAGKAPMLVDAADATMLEPAALLADMRGGLIVEAYLHQHRWYETINASSVNTWRIWVMRRTGSDSARAVLAYLRMGRAGSSVDNMGGGGLYAPLRAEGAIGPGEDGSIYRIRFEAHPDSGVALANARPPFAVEAIALAERALDAFPALNFAGMDIAVAPDGPVVIEVNAEPDRMGAARVGLPFKQWLAERGVHV